MTFEKRLSKTIAEIQFGGMSAAFPEIAIGLACDSCLNFSDRLNHDASFVDKIVEAPTGDGIAATVDNERGFNKIGCG